MDIDRSHHFFAPDYRWPDKGRSVLVAVTRSKALAFPEQKLERLFSFYRQADITLLAEGEERYRQLVRFAGTEANGNRIEVARAATPLSASAVGHARQAGKGFDTAVMLFHNTLGLDFDHVYAVMLGQALKAIAPAVYAITNGNLALPFTDPLNTPRGIMGETLYSPTYLSADDCRLLHTCASRVRGGVITEVGRYLGASTTLLAKASGGRAAGTALYSVDPFLPDLARQILEKSGVAEDIEFITKTSKDAAEQWPSLANGTEIDLLFIDADHSYQAVTQDLRLWTPLVKPGGIVICHDFHDQHNPSHAGVDVAVHEQLFKTGGWAMEERCHSSIACRKV